MEFTHQKKEEPKKKVIAVRADGKYTIKHKDGFETRITEHKFKKRYEEIVK